jgi:O-antigen biosynthesis protein
MQDSQSFHVILCSFQPDPAYFQAQIDSLKSQTYPHFTCEIRDDGSSEQRLQDMREILGDDPRFSLILNPENLGVYRNFEAGLAATPDTADFIAYCDQDDIWAPQKLEQILQHFQTPDIMAVHSDLEIIDSGGATVHPSAFAFEGRYLDDLSASQLIIRNAVTGCTMAFRRSLVSRLLPFPEQSSTLLFHHDLWTAMVAAQDGRIETIRSPIVKYRQHGANIVGAESARPAPAPNAPFQIRAHRWLQHWNVRERLMQELLDRQDTSTRRLDPSLRKWASPSPVSLDLITRTLRLSRGQSPAYRSAKTMILGKALKYRPRIFSLLRGLGAGILNLSNRLKQIATLGTRFLVNAQFRQQVILSLERLSGNPAASSAQDALSRLTPGSPAAAGLESLVMLEKTYLARIPFTPCAPNPCAHFLVPSARCEDIFGGLATAFKFAAILANAGVPVRITSLGTPLSVSDKAATHAYFLDTAGLNQAAADRVSLYAANSESAPSHPNDVFFATAWWTATRLAETIQTGPYTNRKFYYLIQDFEAGFFNWSDEYALAESTYRLDCQPIVNSRYLADFLARETGLKVSHEHIIRPEIAFEWFRPLATEKLPSGPRHKVFVYGRPSTPRNLFAVATVGLRRFISENNLDGESLDVISAGEPHPDIDLGAGVIMRSVGKMTLDAYARELRECDIGLSLMLSPHPSYPPFEMAAAGLTVVTNAFATKTMAFTPNLIAVQPSPDEVADGLRRALLRSSDTEARLAGTVFDLSEQGRNLADVASDIAGTLLSRFQDSAPAMLAAPQPMRSRPLEYSFPLKPAEDFTGKKVCLFSHYDPDNRIDPHVQNYIRTIKDAGFDVILVSSTLTLDEESMSVAGELCSGILLRENRGYDFSGWALALDLLPGLIDADQLLITNDSVYGPLTPLAPIFEAMDQSSCDFWGMTDSNEVQPHIQSYFLAFKRTALRSKSFIDFWSRVRPADTKNEVIANYELTLAPWLEQHGLRSSTYVPPNGAASSDGNRTLSDWKPLISRHHFPFLKVQLLRDNPLGSDLSEWEKIARAAGFDARLIKAHLARVKPESEALNTPSE